MLDALFGGTARAGGIEAPADVKIAERSPSRPSILKRTVDAFRRWHVRRSTYLTLKQIDDRMLRDIGLDRGQLYDVADKMGRRAVANDNTLPVALSALVAYDNDPSVCADCA